MKTLLKIQSYNSYSPSSYWADIGKRLQGHTTSKIAQPFKKKKKENKDHLALPSLLLSYRTKSGSPKYKNTDWKEFGRAEGNEVASMEASEAKKWSS
jgi:hypothetical protein